MRFALPAGSTVAVLGADSTGATDLIEALAPRLSALGVKVRNGAPHADALGAHRGPAITLLVALDPSMADERDTDTLLRAALDRAGVPFAVIHGQGAEQVANALRALGLGASAKPGRIAAWDCDKCSDPVCEHRLFTDLLRGRAEAGTDP